MLILHFKECSWDIILSTWIPNIFQVSVALNYESSNPASDFNLDENMHSFSSIAENRAIPDISIQTSSTPNIIQHGCSNF